MRPATTDAALLEREAELATLRELAGGIARGSASVVLIEGPAGLGKTRLLTEARGLATEAGARTLSARCGELEQELAFGVVRQLLEAVVLADEDSALAGPADAAREAFSARLLSDESEDVSFATLHGLYWLTVNVAAAGPVVLTVDDLQWCDEPSLRYFSYLARRLDGLSVTVIGTMRTRESRRRAGLLGELVADPLAVKLQPQPLSSEASAQLVAARLGGGGEPAFAAACHTATGGNPLFLGELLKTLSSEGVRPDAASVRLVSDIGSRSAAQSVLVRLARLPAEAAKLARSATVLGEGADLSIVAEHAGLASPETANAAAALVDAEILEDSTSIAFVHPVVAAVIYEDMAAPERALAHERAAELLHERSAAPGAVAAQLLIAPASSSNWACDVLERAAHAALRAGAPASAVAFLTRALAEPPEPNRRASVLLELGRAEALVDGPASATHLAEARELMDDPEARASTALALGRVLLFTGRADEGVALARSAAAELPAEAHDARDRVEAFELMSAFFGGAETDVLDRLERHRALPVGPGLGAKMLAAVAGQQWAYTGGPAKECAELSLGALGGGDLVAADSALLAPTAITTLVLADRNEAEQAWRALLAEAHTRGSLHSKAAVSLWRGYTLYRWGELAEAEASLRNAFEELTLWGASDAEGRIHAVAFISAVLRERGDLAAAREALASVTDPGDDTEAARYWLDAMAELLLAEERFAEALAIAEEFDGRFAFLAHPIDTPAKLHRATALSRLGRPDEALALANEGLELARAWGAPGTLARALRVVGTLEGEAGLERLEEAVAAADGSPARLEHAKALFALGRTLRAARRPTDARGSLRRALDIADALGAEALLADARHELHAAGGRPRTKALTGPESLTPSELRVSERAADGQTNREIAEALFVTTKTIELHLRNAYRKLGIGSRRELPAALTLATARPSGGDLSAR